MGHAFIGNKIQRRHDALLHGAERIKELGDKMSVTGREIANALGIHYDGIQPGFEDLPDRMQFTDTAETHTTFYATSLENAREKLDEKRRLFKERPTLESKIDRPLAAKLTGNMIQELKTHRYQRGL